MALDRVFLLLNSTYVKFGGSSVMNRVACISRRLYNLCSWKAWKGTSLSRGSNMIMRYKYMC